jgi:thiol:disulfide interchange protein DsbD
VRSAFGLAAAVIVACAIQVPAAAPRVRSGQAQANPVKWSLVVTSKGPVLPGKPVDVALVATIQKGWHLYALEQAPGGPPPTSISVVSNSSFSLTGDIVAPPAERSLDPNFGVETEYYKTTARFLLPFMVAARVANGPHRLEVATTWVTCSDTLCLPPADAVSAVNVIIGAKDAAAATDGAVPATPATAPDPVAAAAPPAAPSVVVDFAAASSASTLPAYIALAALMGALSLVTPCVFPMVPITVSYFTNRARKSRREAVFQAVTYGLGIILTFTAVGFTLAIGFGASGLNRFAADPWLNLGVTLMFVAFALSLFGVWEFALPSRLVTAASRADSGHGRVAGTLLMGLAFTLTSFTCTAPFLGTLLVVASQGDWQWPLAGMLAFSAVFALPFVVLAFVPQVLASLPRSGPWLLAVKAVMGIIELAAAMKFLSNVDLVWGWHIFTRPVVLASWVVLGVVLVVYLAGLVRLGPAGRLGRPGAGRLALVGASSLLTVWLASGLGGRRLGELEAFLPPADLTSLAPNGELPWIVNDYDAALRQARERGQRILIDFTGYTCTNCWWMEANMFTRPDVAVDLARYVRVRLYTDARGEPYRGFQQMEQSLFGTVALPYYAVMLPDGRPTLGFGGLTRDAAHFIGFLRKGLE